MAITEVSVENPPETGGEDPYRFLFDNSPQPMFVYDRETLRFLAVNEAALRKYGYSRDEFLSMTADAIRPASEVPRFLEALRTVFQPNSFLPAGFWKHRSKSGEIFEMEVAWSAIRFGGRDATLAIVNDVTAHRQAEAGLALRYALTRLLSESSGDVMGKAMRCLCESLEFDAAEFWQPDAGAPALAGKTIWQAPPPEDAELLDAPATLVPLAARQGVLARVWTCGQPDWLTDVGAEPGYRDRAASLRKAGISRGLAFSLRGPSGTSGVAVLLSRRQLPWDPHIDDLMVDIGSQMGHHLERCKAEEELRELFDEAPVPYHEIDRNGVVVRVNRAECRLLGMDASEIVGRYVWDCVSPEERGTSMASVRRKLAEGKLRPPYERTYRASDGRESVFQIHESLITGPAGEVRGIRTAMLDQTEAKRSRQQIEFQAGLLEQVKDAIVTFDRDFKVTYCNGVAERLFGWTAEEARGRKYQELIADDLSDADREALHAEILERGFWRGEFGCVNRRGERLVLDDSSSVLRDRHGDPQGVIAMVRDITASHRMENALRATEDRLTLAQTLLSIGSWEIDLRTQKSKCSEQLLRLYGISGFREGLTFEEWVERLHPDDRDWMIAEVKANEARRDTVDRQYRVVWPDGTVRWLHSKTRVVLDVRGRPAKLIGADFDITEHKRTEERLRILSDAVEQSPVSILITDLDGRIEYANPKTTEVTGYTFEELRGQNPRILKSGHTSNEEYQKLWATIPTGEWSGIFHNRKKNGEFFWEAAAIRPILDSSGKATHYLAVKEDITERRAMEEALRISEERFRIAAENSGDIIYEWDLASGRVRYGGRSREYGTFLGATATQFFDSLHPDDRQRVDSAVRRHLENGSPFAEEYRVVLPSGEVRYWSDHASAVRDAAGKPYKWIGVTKDVTELKAAERANAELAAIVESLDTAIISNDAAANVLTWNAGAERIYGYSAAEMVGRSISVLIPEDHMHEEQEILEKIWRGERTSHLETVRVTRSGEHIPVLLTVSPIRDRAGAVVGAARVASDITRIKLLQRQLAQAQKLESIGQLAAGIAHEINTPIQYIGDNAKFLEEAFRDLVRLVEPPPESGLAALDIDVDYLRDEIPKALEQLLEGVSHVARIVRAMKEFSHPGPVEMTPVDINRAIESTALVSKNEWKYVADLTTDLEPGLPPVPCLAGEVNQVILNLIVNAAHAITDVVRGTGGKGTIRVSTRRCGEWVEIRVSDTGTGIPEAIQPRIFDPFFTTKEVGKGTGQGLSIAHSVIVQKHRGGIKFETQVGVGTTFVIRLPLEARGEET